MRTTKLSSSALEALEASTISDNILFLPGSLDRTTYTEVDKVLKEVGGKWKTKKGHVFPHDPSFEIETIVKTGEVMLLSKNGFFPTPRGLAESVVGYTDVWDGLSVLEPSAGSGGLADVIRELHPSAKLTCVEIQPKLVAQLRAKGHANVILGDFLSMEPEPIYDRVCMNPPFEQQGDIEHITHAFKFLRPGGRLAAIGGGSWQYRQDKKAQAFRDLINDYAMMDEENPSGSFKESGTMVGTRTVVLWKPGE
jgi:phospholipid N-methyltransferase